MTKLGTFSVAAIAFAAGVNLDAGNHLAALFLLAVAAALFALDAFHAARCRMIDAELARLDAEVERLQREVRS